MSASASTLDQHLLSMARGSKVELFDVDLSHINGPVLRFTPNEETFVPATVTRLEDNRTSNLSRIITPVPENVAAQEKIVIEFYARNVSGAQVLFAGFGPTATPQQTASRSGVLVDLQNLTTGGVTGASPVANVDVTQVSQAGEWVYASATFLMGGLPEDTVFILEPAANVAGNTGGANAGNTGVTDFFGFRAWRYFKGFRVPVILPTLDQWDEHANINVSVVANTFEANKVPVWGGNSYTPLPIMAEGFEVSGQGRFPKPRITMSNILGAGSLLQQQYGDIRGAEVTRRRVFAENLDNGSQPNPAAGYTPEVFILTRRTSENHETVEFELSTRLDQQGVKLPRRMVLRDVCPWRYRAWNPDTMQFDYDTTDNGCPYTGAAYFDTNGDPVTDPAEDKCSQRFTTGCRARYGKSETLPFGSFPMAGRTSQT